MYAPADAAGIRSKARNQIPYPTNVGEIPRYSTGIQPARPIARRSATTLGPVASRSGIRRTVPIRSDHATNVNGGYRRREPLPSTAYSAEKIAGGTTVKAASAARN